MTEAIHQELRKAITKIRKFYRGNGIPSFDFTENKCCYYREADDPTKDQRCAVGCLLSLESAKELESLYPKASSIDYVFVDLEDTRYKKDFSEKLKKELDELRFNITIPLLLDLQALHDNLAEEDIETFITQFDLKIAENYGKEYLEDISNDSE